MFLVAVAVLFVIATRWSAWEAASDWQDTDDAYLESDLTPILAKVAGYIRTVPVQDFDHVRAGQLIAEVVDDDYRAIVDQSDANVAAAKAQLETLRARQAVQQANITAATAVIASTSAQLEQNARDIVRQTQLLDTGSSSPEAAEKLNGLKGEAAARGVLGSLAVDEDRVAGDLAVDLAADGV